MDNQHKQIKGYRERWEGMDEWEETTAEDLPSLYEEA
jgi:hypothetical protein